jgi:hypothetical protein
LSSSYFLFQSTSWRLNCFLCSYTTSCTSSYCSRTTCYLRIVSISTYTSLYLLLQCLLNRTLHFTTSGLRRFMISSLYIWIIGLLWLLYWIWRCITLMTRYSTFSTFSWYVIFIFLRSSSMIKEINLILNSVWYVCLSLCWCTSCATSL